MNIIVAEMTYEDYSKDFRDGFAHYYGHSCVDEKEMKFIFKNRMNGVGQECDPHYLSSVINPHQYLRKTLENCQKELDLLRLRELGED